MNLESIRYLVVDDNELDRLMVETLARAYPVLELAGSYAYPLEALGAIKALRPQLVFLDVEMPGATGIELLRAVKEIVPMAVFITSFPDFALEGFELSALDYILKPLTEERFGQAVKRVAEYWEMKQKSLAYDVIIGEDTILIKQGYEQLRLSLNDIVYLEAMSDYTKITTSSKRYITNTPLSGFLEKLPERHFMRVHRSYAVARSKIEVIRTGELICGGTAIPVGKTYRSAIAQIKIS